MVADSDFELNKKHGICSVESKLILFSQTITREVKGKTHHIFFLNIVSLKLVLKVR